MAPVASLVLVLAGCTPVEEAPVGVQPREFSDCDPISYDYCALPYPSSFYEREDAASPTGVRVHLGEQTLPLTKQGHQPTPEFWNRLDGFSPMGPILARFRDLSLEGVPLHDDIGASLEDASPIVLFDADTGERQPFFAELDVSGEHVAGREFLMIRPVRPLAYGRRYIVGIRNLTDTAGALIPASDGYAALRDGTATENWDIEGRRDLYAGIFTALEGQGWNPGETQLAWDFMVGSKEGITGRAVFMRDDALAYVAADGTPGPAYVVDSVVEYSAEENANIYRAIEGHLTVPYYTETDRPGTVLTRGGDGLPYVNGETTIPFTVLLPRTAQEDPRPLKLVQYGHGLLGGQDEVYAGYLGEMANRYGYVLFAVDWTGMKEEDSSEISAMLVTQIERFASIPERSQQGFVEFVLAANLMQTAMVWDQNFTYADGDGLSSVIDPSEVYYYGNSQGGIMGGAYLALSPVISRGVLGVPGMPYSLLLSRSADFDVFFFLFQNVYPDQEDISFFMALMQNLWDSGEPSGYARAMIDDPLAGVPTKQVLIQDALGDAQVTTLGAQNMARAYHAALIDSPVHEVWGLETAASGWTGSALVEFDFGVPIAPFVNTPPSSETDTHEDTRRAFAGQEQINAFLTTGTVVHFCDGVCDPD